MNIKVKIKIKNISPFPLPKHETTLASGLDLHANVESKGVILARQRKTIPTGICIELPEGYEAQVRPRSGLAMKNGVKACFGTIDADFRGEICMTIFNDSDRVFHYAPGDRLAQLVIAPVVHAEWVESDELSKTERGSNGWQSTGIK